jgi:hypothetical protein
MAAGLERAIERGAFGPLASLGQRNDFRVRFTRAEMAAAPDDLSIPNHESADHRVWGGQPSRALREGKRLLHIGLIGMGDGHVRYLPE